MGVSVHGGLSPGGVVSVQGGSLYRGGSLSRKGISVQGGVSVQGWGVCQGKSLSGVLCPERGFCPGESLSAESLSRESLSRWGGVSVQMGSLSRWGGGLCPGGLCLGDLCPGGSLSRRGGGSLFRWEGGSLSRGGLCPGLSLSLGGVSIMETPRADGTHLAGMHSYRKKFQSGINEHSLTIFSCTRIFRTQMFMLIFISLPDIKIHKKLFTNFGNS